MAPELIHDSFGRWVAAGRDFVLTHAWEVLDMSEPSEPMAVAALDVENYGVARAHDSLLVLGAEGEVRTWDLSLPAAPVELGRARAPIGELVLPSAALSPSGERAWFLLQSGEVVTADVSDPSHPSGFRVLDLPLGPPPSSLHLLDGSLLIRDWGGGLRRLDADLEILGAVDLLPPDDLASLSVDGTRALAGSSQGGVQLFELENPDQPRLLSILPVSGSHSILLSGVWAWTVVESDQRAWSHRLLGWDLTDPTLPVLVRDFPLSGSARYLISAQGRVYVAESNTPNGGMRIFDVTSSDQAGYLHGCRGAMDVRNFLLVAGCTRSTRGVFLFDVRDPAAPIPLGSHDSGSTVTSVRFLDDTHVVVGHSNRDTEVLDVSDPSRPELEQVLEIGGGAWQMVPAAGGGLWVRGAGVALIRDVAALFSDGFESGGSAAWSGS